MKREEPTLWEHLTERDDVYAIIIDHSLRDSLVKQLRGYFKLDFEAKEDTIKGAIQLVADCKAVAIRKIVHEGDVYVFYLDNSSNFSASLEEYFTEGSGAIEKDTSTLYMAVSQEALTNHIKNDIYNQYKRPTSKGIRQ